MAASRYTLTREEEDRLIKYALQHMATNGNGHAPKPRAPWGSLKTEAKKPGPKTQPPMSAAQRAKLSRAMVKRWALAKKAGNSDLKA